MIRSFFTLSVIISCISILSSQNLPPKTAYPFNIKQIHSGHSLTDPLFANWPGQYVNLVAHVNNMQGWQLFDVMVGKSTIPGSPIKARWDNPPGYGAPDARHQINNWALLTITERVPMAYEGGNSAQWYLDWIQEQKTYLSLFVNNAWNNGNNGAGAPTLLWTTWTNIDNRDGPWRQMLDIQGGEWERMQDYANANKPTNAPHVYIIPGHKMMARLYDDIQLNQVPGITNINQFFSDNIHVNTLGAYAVAMIHYACIFNQSPVGLTNNLLPSAPSGTPLPSPALAHYLQTMIWQVVTTYNRTGISAALPVTFSNLQGYNENGKNVITFNTLHEKNNSHFSLEKSYGEQGFHIIDQTNGAGNSTTQKSYQFTDLKPSEGQNYYRICQTDFDGKKSYSEVISILNRSANTYTVQNTVVNDRILIQNQGTVGHLLLFDSFGNLIQRHILQEGDNHLNVGELPSGIYHIKSNEGFPEKIVKIN